MTNGTSILPNWIIAGAPKAATSSVFRWLMDHPQVDGSREKETCYFVDSDTHMYRAGQNFATGGVTGYARLFAHCDPAARVILESTPAYLYSETALRELPQLGSNPQFIFILREPVAQLKSLFTYFRENWKWIPRDMSFREFIAAADNSSNAFSGNELAADATRNAAYADHLLAWRRACGAGRMQIYLFEDVIADKREFMRGLAARMSIEPGFYDDYAFPAENVTYAVRSPLMQKINLWARALIPAGRTYRMLRRVYRAINTVPAPASGLSDPEIELALSRRFLSASDRLEQELGLDVSRWRQVQRARLAAGDGTSVDAGFVPASGDTVAGS